MTLTHAISLGGLTPASWGQMTRSIDTAGNGIVKLRLARKAGSGTAEEQLAALRQMFAESTEGDEDAG